MVELKNKLVYAAFDEDRCRLVKLVNLQTGDSYLKQQPSYPVFELTLLDEQAVKSVCLPGTQVKVTESEDGAAICYPRLWRNGEQVEICVTLNLSLHGDELEISLETVNNETSLSIVELLCPHIGGVLLGDTHTDNVIFYPHHAGERTVNPAQEYATKRYMDFWRAQSVPVDGVFRREINYCGLASMSWMYYQNALGGLYIGSHDPEFPVTGVIAEAGGEQSPYMGFAFRKHHRVAPGERYCAGSYCLGVYGKDWHRGAERYRSYIGQYLTVKDTPEFLNEEYLLNQCYNFKKDGKIDHRFCDIPAMFERGMEFGARHMFIASWNRKGFDCNYPEYYPDMELGSAMELCRGIEYVKSRGGFVTFYINARLFDLKSDFYPSVGSKMAIRDYTGRVLTESYGPVEFSLSCPSDSRWQRMLVDTALFTMRAYGIKGIYLDQLASAEPFACYAPGHSHADIGEFNRGYMAILNELLTEMRRVDKDAYLMTENCGDIYGSYVWGNLTWNGTHYDEFFNMFRFTFPTFVQVNMVNPRSWVKDPEENKTWFYKDIQRSALLGSVIWMGFTNRIKDNEQTEEDARRAIDFRARCNSYIISTTYRDTAYITAADPALEASVWEGDESILVLVGDYALCGGSLTLELPCDVKLHEHFDERQQTREGAVAQNERTVCIKINGSRLLAVALDKVDAV